MSRLMHSPAALLTNTQPVMHRYSENMNKNLNTAKFSQDTQTAYQLLHGLPAPL